MNKTNKFLLKIFCVTLVFVCNFTPSMAVKVQKKLGYITQEEYDSFDMVDTKPDTRCVATAQKKKCYIYTKEPEEPEKDPTKTLCPKGSYLSQCGDYVLGINTMRSVYVINEKDPTNDYYEECIGSDPTKPNVDSPTVCIRAFFNSAGSDINTLIQNRDYILGWICSPETTSGKYTCLKCPNGGTVDASTVKISATDGGIIPNSFNIQTIASCYQNTFKDDTGTYVYKEDNINTPQKCFYTSDNIPEGTEIEQVSTFFETETKIISIR